MVKKPEELKKGLHFCVHDLPCAEEMDECPYYGDERGCMETMLSDCQAYILTLEADKAKIQAQNAALVKQHEWISVKDRLPEEPCAVLVVLYGSAVCVAWYSRLGWFETGSGMFVSAGHGVSHWMPLPEPPKEEQ